LERYQEQFKYILVDEYQDTNYAQYIIFHAARIVDDHRVGRLDDRARRTVVLFQLEDFRFEYQDTNYAQYIIVRRLSQHHGKVCVVGDDAQSIYSFRGAYDQLGLLAVGVGFQHTDLLALVALREAPLFHAARIVDDHRIGRLDDRARRTVVLFQLEDFRFGIVALEGEDVFDLGAAERVRRATRARRSVC